VTFLSRSAEKCREEHPEVLARRLLKARPVSGDIESPDRFGRLFMKSWSKGYGVWLLASSALIASACSSASDEPPKEQEFGTLGLPLSTEGSSGVTYRLRDATFRVRSYDAYYEGDGGSGSWTPTVTTVSSEDDPDAATIALSVPAGDQQVTLQPGWRLERVTETGTETIEATLLSGSTRWLWVRPHATSFAEFRFGVGGREIWFNGQLNIGIDVAEDPDEYYGTAGDSGVGGSPSVGTGAGGGD
jgi:hypothetical protein